MASFLERKELTFVPKNSNLVVHVLSPSRELNRLYRNVEIGALRGISIEYLFASFARAILWNAEFLSPVVEVDEERYEEYED